DLEVTFYDSEEEVLHEVFKALNDYPFVLTFNGDEFDLRYLWHRALNLGFKREEIPIEAEPESCLLSYGIHLDLYRFFFNKSIQTYAFRHKYHNATLDDVGLAILGKGKMKIGDKPISDLTYSELARYCSRDAEIVLELSSLDDDLVIKLILAISRISKMTMEDVSRQGVSRWIRSLFYYEHRRRGMLIPNKEDILELKGGTATRAVIKGKKYKGAIVVEPEPGVHFNVLVLDFASMYPSIIKEYNLGYQTVLCPHQECRKNKVPGTTHWICVKNKSVESLVIGSLRDLRVRWYKTKSKSGGLSSDLRSWYEVIQQALKVILNASYGVFGAEAFDLYCPPVAESTAAIGREAITKTIGKAEELGIKTVYGDTDSIFIKEPTENQVKTLVEWSEKDLKLGLEVDKVYRYSVFSSRKKNYLGVYMDGRVEAKGLMGIKRHIPTFLEKAFDEVLRTLGEVRTPADFEKAKIRIEEIVRECYFKLKRKEYPLEDLAYQVVLGKPVETYVKTTPQHVKAALLLKVSGKSVESGDIIKYVKTIGNNGVKPLALASKNEVDVSRYVGDVRNTFSQILDPLGMDFDEIIGFTRLEQFM
ncbi:MAG: DNA-directed DNA polymerase I, partial [Candidatus Bathyarchaeia archaeon]